MYDEYFSNEPVHPGAEGLRLQYSRTLIPATQARHSGVPALQQGPLGISSVEIMSKNIMYEK